MKRYRVRTEKGRLGSLDGPAISTSSGLRQWFVDGRLHRSDGPAVETASGTRIWYWRGIAVPREVIEDPRATSPIEILGDPNAEVRRARMEAYGLTDAVAALLAHGKATVVHAEPDPEPRRLFRISAIKDSDGESPQYVEVKCPSTGRVYHLRVSPDATTCTEAVAWTFRAEANAYRPEVQT